MVDDGAGATRAVGGKDDGDDEPRPWHRNPLLWTLVVVGAIGAALLVSVVAGTDARDPALADVDHTEFCREAQSLRSELVAGFDPSRDVGSIRRLSESMRRVEAAAPEVIRGSVKAWADGYYDAARKMDMVLESNPGGGSIPDYDALFAVIDNVGSEKSVDIDRVVNYTRKACGLDISGGSVEGSTDAPASPGDGGVTTTGVGGGAVGPATSDGTSPG